MSIWSRLTKPLRNEPQPPEKRFRQYLRHGDWTDRERDEYRQEWQSERPPGCRYRVSRPGEWCPLASERIKTIPKRDWPDLLTEQNRVNLRQAVPVILNQGRVGCHDDQTEVLTELGWQPWSEYDRKTSLGTINPETHALEFQTPSAFHAYEYDGMLYGTDRRSLDFAVTPEHRMYVRRWNERNRTLNANYDIRTAEELGWYSGILASPSGFCGVNLDAISIGNAKYRGDDFIAMVSLVISDGWVGGAESTWNRVSFCCFREDRYEMVAELAHRLGFREQSNRRGVWEQKNPELANWFRSNIFTGEDYHSPNKRIPQLIKCVGTRQADLFLMWYGDQHIYHNSGRRAFYTSSLRLADDLQEMLMHIGKRGGICEHKPRGAQFRDGRYIDVENVKTSYTVSEWKASKLSIERKTVDTCHYKGMVYCATVPNSLLVTRRNKQVLISGNSCAAEASTGSLMTTRNFRGQEHVPLNPWFVYRVTSGGRDSGSNIDSNLRFIREYGCAPESLHPRSLGWSARPSEEAKEAALRFRIDEFFDISTIEELGSALLQGFTVVYGRAMHAIYAVNLRSMTEIEYANSWAPTWGDQGFGRDSLSRVNFGYGAWATRTTYQDDAPTVKRASELPPMFSLI
jgi:hypothetical protein